jgi:hypothetical protein
MLDRLEEAIRKSEISVPSANFYEEARTFILVEMSNPSGSTYAKPVAAPGCNDDEILATAIALQLHLHGGVIRGEKAIPKEGINIYKPIVKREKKEIKASAYEWW